MYIPKHFSETRPEVLRELMRSCPFGTLVTMTSDGLEANHIPFILKSDPRHHGRLQGHVSRANSMWKTFRAGVEALIIFQGPQAYISPSWYAEKQETGRVVPTWNYIVVHAYGSLRVVHDRDWLHNHVEELTHEHEYDRQDPWHVSDAPSEFTTKMINGIVGLEVTLSRVVGKWKLGQNRSSEDQAGMRKGLISEQNDLALSMTRYLGEN